MIDRALDILTLMALADLVRAFGSLAAKHDSLRTMTEKPDDKLPKDEVERARDDVLKRMLKTPPKPHKDEPRKGSQAARQRRARTTKAREEKTNP